MVQTYSQPATRQDEWVIERLQGKRDGYYVEIGAHDGVRHSNTKMLEEHYGWRGLLVEPQPDLFSRLMSNRKSERNKLAAWVIGRRDDEEVFFLEGDSYGGIDDYMPDDWLEEHKRRGTRGQRYTTVSLARLLNQNRMPTRIDYLSLDVEGAELPILEGFWSKGHQDTYKFGIITVEFRYDDVLLARMEELLEPQYVLEHVEAFDAFFVNKELR